MSAAPRIGIAVGRESNDGRQFDATPHDYVAAVLEAGGVPVLLPPLPVELAPRALDGVDGLLLTGGGDVSPACYGASTVAPETNGTDDERDASELALVAVADARHLPILGICRGAQLLNVAFGGTLHQHLSAHEGVAHRQGRRRYETVHRVVLDPHSVLADLVGRKELSVNSIHHQGIDVVGASLVPVGLSEDGLPEVLESPDRSMLAVQWHPECLPLATESRELFRWLVNEAQSASSNG